MAKKITWQLKTYKLADLTDYFKNPRHITETEFKQLKKSLDTFGLIDKPIINADAANTIIGGHQRKHVLEANGETECECWVPDRELTEREVEELNIRLNKNTGDWDFDVLANEWNQEDLLDWGFSEFELGLDGVFDDDDMTAGADAEPQISKAEELREKWNVKSGQMWQLGEHRLICGDCTDASVVDRLMHGERAELAPVDPPYNVGFDYDGSTVDDLKNPDTYKDFSEAWFSVCQSVSEKQIITPGCNNLAHWLRWFEPLHWAPWTKSNSMTNGRVSRFWCWEPVLFFGEKWQRRRANDLFDYPIGKQEGVANHPCPKPLKMWEDLIENYSEPNAIIFECFSGSGTTLIACERLGRKCRAVEISPAYVAVAIQRWVDVTGGEPILLQ